MFSFLNRYCSKWALYTVGKSFMLCAILFLLESSLVAALAQGLVGAPVDPHVGTSCGGSSLADYAYDTELPHNICRIIALVLVVIAWLWPIPKHQARKLGLVMGHLAIRTVVPALLYVCFIHYVNLNYYVSCPFNENW